MRVLITGATRGIGKALALDYAAAGADVVALGRDEARLEAVIHTASLDEASRNAWCRENGVYPAELAQWRDRPMTKSVERSLKKQTILLIRSHFEKPNSSLTFVMQKRGRNSCAT